MSKWPDGRRAGALDELPEGVESDSTGEEVAWWEGVLTLVPWWFPDTTFVFQELREIDSSNTL